MKTFWLDTEFNGFGGELISAALVAEDGTEWYKTVGCKNPVPWAAENVIPHLGIKPVKLATVQESLRVFLSHYEHVNIISDWPTDIEHFCNLLCVRPFSGSIIHTPPLSFEVKPWLNGQFKSAIQHNALEDARALMQHDLNHS